MRRLPRLEQLEARTLLASVPFGLVDGHPAVARIALDGGGQVVASLRGLGTGTATVSDGRVHLVLEGTSAATTVTLKSAGRSPLPLGDVDATGALGALKAPTAEASGVFTFGGGVGAVDLRSAGGLSVRAPGLDVGSIRVGAAGSKRAAPGAGVVFAGEVDARRLGTMTVGGSATLHARVQFVHSVAVAGDLSQSTITVMPAAEGEDAALGHLSVGGTMRGVKIVTMGDVGTVRAGAMAGSEVMAGIRYGALADGTFEHVLPAESHTKDFDFTGQYRVGAVAVTGLKGQRRAAPGLRARGRPPVYAASPSVPPLFTDSRIAAYEVGDVLLEAVAGSNGGRVLGVAAYRIGSVVRRWADPSNPGADFAVRQTSEPLVYREGPGGYGGYFGGGYAGGVVLGGAFDSGGGYTQSLPYIDIPAGGAAVGSASVNGQSATLFLMPDGGYELRSGSESPIARDATLAGLVLAVAGTPGTSMKVVHRPAAGITSGSAQFLSTSVSGTVTLTLPANPKPYRFAVRGPDSVVISEFHGMPVLVPGVVTETFYNVPAVSDLAAALQAAGTDVRTFDREFVLVKPEGAVVGRAFDDTGPRKIVLTAQNTFRLTGADDAVLWEGGDVVAGLMGPGPRLGLRRLPARLVGGTQLFLYGLARGGTAVFDVGGRATLDPAGNVTQMPDGNEIAGRLRAAGLDFTAHGL